MTKRRDEAVFAIGSVGLLVAGWRGPGLFAVPVCHSGTRSFFVVHLVFEVVESARLAPLFLPSCDVRQINLNLAVCWLERRILYSWPLSTTPA